MLHGFCRRFWTAFYYMFRWVYFGSLGKGCRFEGHIRLLGDRNGLHIGDDVRICENVLLIAARGSRLVIGDRVFLGSGVKVSCHDSIDIGHDTIIAEYVCIHDNDHVFDRLDAPIMAQGFATTPVKIGSDCWIGSHCVIVRGGGLGEKSVLGAGAILTKQLPSRSVAVGVPARVIRQRQ
jgi:acetyltransferase-like isoleucine patch superfamily enzyme